MTRAQEFDNRLAWIRTKLDKDNRFAPVVDRIEERFLKAWKDSGGEPDAVGGHCDHLQELIEHLYGASGLEEATKTPVDRSRSILV